jgi:hypothetical protein
MPTIIVQGRQVPVNDSGIGLTPRNRDRPRPKHSWSELPASIVPSAVDNITGAWDLVTHPRRTAEDFIDTVQGGVDRIVPEGFTRFMDTYVSPRSAETRERQRQVSSAILQALKDRYWGLDNLKNTLITDPVGSALDVAGIAAGGGGLLRRPVTALAKSRVNGLFNPKPKPQRPLLEDYPKGVELDDEGYITKDIEGRPLDAPYIVGRRRVDAPDRALTPLDIQRVGEYGIEGPVDKVPGSQLGPGTLGRTHIAFGRPTKIEVLDSLPKAEMDIATAHEVGHVIDALSGQIPTKGLEKELDFNYSALRTGEERKFFQSTPQDFGYKDHYVDREKIAEAIRAYMVDPNYLKTVAPKTAARIREYVHNSPELSKIIQLNSLAGGGALALGATGQNEDSQAADYETSKADSADLRELKRALARRGLYSKVQRSPEKNDLIHALMAREADHRAP